ncbi:MAG: hypothetical protein QOJ65_2713 [Fimbriimonadaceae bacterium]|jgi:DNA-binding CsgD family transcriptional regulator|nr:hypothetical protein [Fimbriimonadaceae bacterium]
MKPRAERNTLSQREDEVLKLASTGLTDQQIANVLRIRVSTVTTYWVRIRGKVGQVSRAEMIAQSVRQGSQAAMNDLKTENAKLRAELGQKLTSEADAVRSACILRACLDQVSSGLLVVRPDGGVAVSNKPAEELLGVGDKQLEGLCIQDLIPQVQPSYGRTAVLERPSEKLAVRPDGTTVSAQVDVRPLDGSAPGWVAVLLKPAKADAQ